MVGAIIVWSHRFRFFSRMVKDTDGQLSQHLLKLKVYCVQSEKCKRKDLFIKDWFSSIFHWDSSDTSLWWITDWWFMNFYILVLNFNENNTFKKKLQWMKRWWSGDWLNLHCILCLEDLNKLWFKCIQKWILFYICKNTPHTCLLFLRLAFSKKRCIIIEANFSKLGMY